MKRDPKWHEEKQTGWWKVQAWTHDRSVSQTKGLGLGPVKVEVVMLTHRKSRIVFRKAIQLVVVTAVSVQKKLSCN